jgi:[protein-PII] uridylyltransferase
MASRRTEAFDRAIAGLTGEVSGGVTVAALGGYGRREMTPGSDVDLLIVHEAAASEAAASLIETVTYPLWDAGIEVSHAVRTPEQCRALAREDLSSLTTMLGARLLAGHPEQLERASTLIVEDARADLRAFLERLRISREERRGRFGSIGHDQQPHLKDGLGGLRDIDLLSWLSAVAGEGRPSADRGAIRGLRATVKSLTAGPRSLLLSVRTALHRSSGRSNEVLRPDHWHAVADMLGVPGEPGWDPVDRLVREVFLAGRWVAYCCGELLDRRQYWPGAEGKKREAAARGPKRGPGPAGSRPAPSGPGKSAEALLLALARDALVEGDWPPLTNEPPALRGEIEALAEAAWTPFVAGTFLELMRGQASAEVLGKMDAIGLLGKLVPEWNGVRGRPQHDPYHRHPVDVHLIETVAEAGRLLRRDDEPLVAGLVESFDDPNPLLLAALLHDVGKTGTGSHVPAGVEVARRVLDRMGLAASDRDDVLFLVREHLLLSDTAVRRHLEDEDLILRVAARIGDERRLAMLYVLTLADAAATGPAASTPWRLALVRELVVRVHRAFARGLMDRGLARRIEEAEAALRRELAREMVSDGEIEAFLRAMPTSYALSVSPGEAARHVRIVLPPPGTGEIRTDVQHGPARGTWRVAVAGADRLGLLATIAGALRLAGLSILGAQAFTSEDGVALDLFDVRPSSDHAADRPQWERFAENLALSLGGRLDLDERVRALGAHYRPPSRRVPVRVRIHDDASDFFTVVEVEGPDRLGLLFDLARTFVQHDIDVHTAKVATYGPRVVDVFYVTDRATGEKLSDPGREQALKTALAATAHPHPLETTS